MAASERVIVPRSEIVGTPEWADRLVDAIKADHRYAERDVSLFAEHADEAKRNQIWQTALGDGGTWSQFCDEKLNLPADYVDAIIAGVSTLRGRGHQGAIPAVQARQVADMAHAAKPLAPVGRPGKDDNYHNFTVEQGTSADYLTARIARDRPDILERMKQGEYRSVRAAAIDAGIVNPKERYSLPSDPQAAGRYLAERVDREWLDIMIAAYKEATLTIHHYAIHGGTHTEYRVRFDKATERWTLQRRLGEDRWQVVSQHDTRDDARARQFALAGADMRGQK